MELSKMFGVERGEIFRVNGVNLEFMIDFNTHNYEYLKCRIIGSTLFDNIVSDTLFRVIAAAPAGIIHLPPPLTDEQREQLKAIYTLGGRWLAKDDASGSVVFCYQARPEKAVIEWTVRDVNDEFMEITHFVPAVAGLVSWSDPEPFDIGKALGVTE